MSTNYSAVDLNDLVFLNKNKEYGAFALRQSYSRFLSYAMVIAFSSFVLSLFTLLIFSYFKTPFKPTFGDSFPATPIQISDPPPIDVKRTQPKLQEAGKPIKMIKFFPPVVKPDAEITTNDISPTQPDLSNSIIGGKDIAGTPGHGYELPAIPIEKPIVEEPAPKIDYVTHVEEMPTFPGGSEAFMQHVAKSIHYPVIAIRTGTEGKIFVSFIVNKDGSIRDVQLLKSIGAGCDEEALRVIKEMPRWNPGRQNGNPVNVKISVPIIFKLQ